MRELRPATPDEMPALRRLVGAALAIDPARFADLAPEMTLCAFDDDRLASVHGSWPLTLRFNGNAVPISGVTSVATGPADRGAGHLRSLVSRHFHDLHDSAERPIAALYASQAEIYQRFGYAIVSTHHHYRIEPRHLRFVEPLDIPGVIRDADPSAEFPLLVDLYRAYRHDRTGLLHRGRPMWSAGVLQPAEGKGAAKQVAIYEEDGEPLGYCIYTTAEDAAATYPDPPQRLEIADFVALTPLAYHALWRYLARFQLVRFIEWPQAPADDPLPHLILEPRMLRDTASEGLLARIVDLPASVAARGYDTSATLTVELLDDLCPWNAGRWTLEISPDGARALPLGSGEPQLSMTINTFAMLLFGQISATRAARAGRLGVHDARALPAWDLALATRHAPFCADHF